MIAVLMIAGGFRWKSPLFWEALPLRALIFPLLLIALFFLLSAPADAQMPKSEAYQQTRKELSEKTLQKRIFPGVNPEFYTAELAIIALHAGKQNLLPLKENGLRLVTQPAGIVGEFYDIDLDSGEVIVIPGTHDKGAKWRFTLSAEKLAKLREILNSAPFWLLVEENRKRGPDGQSLFLELKWQGEHRWILRWGHVEKVLWEPFQLVRNAMRARYRSNNAEDSEKHQE